MSRGIAVLTFKHLHTHREGAVEYLTLDRPDVRNAFDDEVVAELSAWAEAAAGDAYLRAVVLAGAGSAFCAGADLAWMSRTASYTHAENVRDASAAARMFAAFDRLPVPLIARVHGAVIGGGAGLVAVCDVGVAEERTTFGFTEVKVGIVPAVISPYVVGKIGPSAARELFLTGMPFDAARAREIGLVHAVVPAGDLDARVASYVRDVLGAAPGAVAAAKDLVRRIAHVHTREIVDFTAELIAARRASPEGQEGLRAFLEKRRASWNVPPDSDRKPR